jgi:membrane protease YdiL (CAAX protease family)
MSFVFVHLLGAYATLVAPLLSYRRVRQLRRSDMTQDKTRLYRHTVLMQVAVAASVAGLWLLGGVPAASLGLLAPRSWWMSAGVGGGIISYFVYVGIRQRPKAQKLRERMRGRGGGVLLPDTTRELTWFTVVCVLSGIVEESVYRGFLCFYISLYLPHINGPGLVLLTSLVFGIGHAYQGWRGIASTTVSGLIFGTLYVVSGSLLLPAVVHSTGNLQAVLILWPQPGADKAPA